MNTLISARFLYLSALLLATCLLPAGPLLAQGGDPWLEQAKLVASDGAAGDEFGISVALDGDTAAVGAWQAEVDGNALQGAVYILTRSGEDWTQVARLTASDGAADDRFGSSVALDGATVLVGSPEQQAGGAAYVFVDEGTGWTEQARLVAAGGQPGDDFGFSVALDGDTALVGANRADVEGSDNGAAYIFTRDGAGAWTEHSRLVPDDWPFGACSPSIICPRFGHSVALGDGTAIIGTPNLTVDGALVAGAAYIFVLDAGAWIQQAKLTRSEPAQQDVFGTSVALRGDTALVGATGVPDNSRQGVVHTFTRAGGVWSEQQVLADSDGLADDQFGQSVALLDNSAVIGAFAQSAGRPGAAYVYALDSGAWNEQDKLTDADGADEDRFGVSVALSGSTVLVGASRAVDANGDQGAAYVFVAAAPALSFDPAGLDFGDIELGQTSAPQTATLSNTGEAEATGLAFNTPGSGFNTDTTGCGTTLPGGGSCPVSVTFTPAATGPAAATLTADSDQAVSADLALSGEGIEPAQLSFSPAGLVFGDVELGQTSAPQTATLSNTGDVEATGLAFNTPGNGFAADTAGCGTTLPAGGSCPVSVTFTPAATGAAAATLTVDSDQAVSADLTLSGEGIEPAQLSFSPAALDFGDVELGQTSAPQTATLSNTGEAEATGLAFDPPGNGFAADTGDCPATLPAGADCQVSVTFTPADAGPAGDTLIVNGDPNANGELSAGLDLSGNGQEPGVLAATPDVLDFGEVIVGSTDRRTATVSNTAAAGAATLTLSAIDRIGDAEFSLVGGSCSIDAELAPGDDCSVTIDFGPGSEGDFIATLLVATGDGQDADVDLAGNGVQPEPFDEWQPQATLVEPEGGQMHSFGFSVALDGNTALVGQTDRGPTISTSRAYVSERDGEAWSEPVALQPAEHPLVCPTRYEGGDDRMCPQFGWSMAVDGDVAVVGQPWTPSGAAVFINPRQPQGAAYVFVRQGDQWVEQARLMAADGHNGDAFGWNVAISGDTIVVGAPTRVAQQPDRDVPDPHGAAYVFVRQGDNWVEQARLFHDDFPLLGCPRKEDGSPGLFSCRRYGWSVAIEGDTVLVGAPGEGLGPDPDAVENSRKGSVYVFTRDGGAWSQQAKLVASDGKFGHELGASVALQGETALIGAVGAGDAPNETPGDNPGAAYVFTRSGTTWTERQRLLPSDGGGFDLFGGLANNGVALAGDIALVGAIWHDTDGNVDQGAAYLYTRDDGIWTERQQLTVPPGTVCNNQTDGRCNFGGGIALSGNTALVGAVKVDVDAVAKAGKAYIFVGPDFVSSRIFHDGFESEE